ncbi:MAG TPA: hypothetical protein VGG89_17785 [Candidatus Baltobacteraceae bacterium]|jgi:hypothetical protein
MKALLLAVAFAMVGVLAACGDDSSSSSSDSSDQTAAPVATAAPISVAARKKKFVQSVDESISGAMIAGNKYKYVGKDVDLHCTVASVIDENGFNATCGEDDDGDPVNIVVLYSYTKSLDQGQTVRILGTVEQPAEGSNAMGGSGTFPTVKAEFME